VQLSPICGEQYILSSLLRQAQAENTQAEVAAVGVAFASDNPARVARSWQLSPADKFPCDFAAARDALTGEQEVPASFLAFYSVFRGLKQER
jgi:hypothetical protein